MKFLYVLVSSKSDYYYEQALMSVYSLKRVMPKAFVTLVVDDGTSQTLQGKRAEILKYIDEYKIIQMDNHKTSQYRSRFLKTKVREFIDGDILYVDVDTVFCDVIDSSVFNDDVMGVPDGHCLLKDHPMLHFIENNLKICGFNPATPYHINGGILYLKDSERARNYGKRWHQLWLQSVEKGVSIDQPSLNQANADFGNIISILPGAYNAQILRSINELADAKIIHYFSSWTNEKRYTPSYRLLQDSFLQMVREKGLCENVKTLLENPKRAFDKHVFLLNGSLNDYLQSKLSSDLAILAGSDNSAVIKLYNFLIRFIPWIIRKYYKFVPYLSPVYHFIKRK